jgi:DNA replication licensing factor MCM5
MAKHVINIHMNAAQVDKTTEGELSLSFLKKYIAYCRSLVLMLFSL